MALLLSVIHSRRSKTHLTAKFTSKHRLRDNSTAANNTTKAAAPRIQTIPFSSAANQIDSNINVVGEKVDKTVTLDQFPFKISRCDQIVLFPCAFINNDDDYRVRKPGFAAITTYYTNLYADKDGQKLIQHVLHAQMPSLPSTLSGAEGCIRVSGDKGQKTMSICVPTKTNAENLLDVYKDFARCRLGDNLTPISAKHLKMLMALCNIDKKKLMETPANGQAKPEDSSQSPDKSNLKQQARNQKLKKLKPQFDFPKEEDNKWEQDRLKYFMPTNLNVPGSRPVVKLPPGIKPGLNPIDNPGVAPPSA